MNREVATWPDAPDEPDLASDVDAGRSDASPREGAYGGVDGPQAGDAEIEAGDTTAATPAGDGAGGALSAPGHGPGTAPAPLATTAPQHCGEPECEENPLYQCAYVDSHARSCTTMWCETHDGGAIGGLRYCRRHAGTMSALGSKANNPRALPDVGNRAASLVRWIYRDLDEAITGLLERNASADEHLLRDSEVAVACDAEGARRWEMSWKVASPAGLRLRITLLVEEKDDSIIHVRLGDEVLASGTPPWIEARRLGVRLDPDIDAAQRRDFYAFLVNFLDQAVSQVL